MDLNGSHDSMSSLNAFFNTRSSSPNLFAELASHPPTPHPVASQNGNHTSQWHAQDQQRDSQGSSSQNHSFPPPFSTSDSQWLQNPQQMQQPGFPLQLPFGALPPELLLEALRNAGDIQPQDEPLIIDALVEANRAGHSYKVALNGLHGVCRVYNVHLTSPDGKTRRTTIRLASGKITTSITNNGLTI